MKDYLVDLGVSVFGFFITGFVTIQVMAVVGKRECGSPLGTGDFLIAAAFVAGIFLTLQINKAIANLRWSLKSRGDVPF